MTMIATGRGVPRGRFPSLNHPLQRVACNADSFEIANEHEQLHVLSQRRNESRARRLRFRNRTSRFVANRRRVAPIRERLREGWLMLSRERMNSPHEQDPYCEPRAGS